jgi:hypothetical protein
LNFIFEKQTFDLPIDSQSRYTLNTQNVGEKPNATATVEGRFPIWNDLVFVDTLDRNVSTEGIFVSFFATYFQYSYMINDDFN